MDIDLSAGKLESMNVVSPDEEDDGEAANDVAEEEFSGEEDDEEDSFPMTLGFVEKPVKAWSLLRQYFPSKAGGAPAWLDPIHLPSGKSTLCDFCGEPLQFLLQVYAPLAEESTFHRTLFVFMCPSMACLLRDQHEQWKRNPENPSRSVKVFRCQLPRENSFYSREAPAEDGSQSHLTGGAMLCNWCGTWKGDKICSSCKRARYCSGAHQTAHWLSSKSSHKFFCRQLEPSCRESESVWADYFFQTAACNSFWEEYEISNDDSCEFDAMSNDNGSANSFITGSQVDGPNEKLRTCFEGNEDNRSWASFQERVSLFPDQVLRYSSSAHAKPLWPVSSGRPSRFNIPQCNYCGGTRVFEFQVLPQLLYFFHVQDGENSLDWATIVVYTCEASCEGHTSYKEEFAWVQLDSPSVSHK